MPGLRLIAAVLTLLCGAGAVVGVPPAASEEQSGPALPDRPPDQIFDAVNLLPAAVHAELSAALRAAAARDGVRIYAIVLARAPEDPAATALLMADHWSGGTLPTVVIMRTPGVPPRLSIASAATGSLRGDPEARREGLEYAARVDVLSAEGMAESVRRTLDAFQPRLAAPALPDDSGTGLLLRIGLPVALAVLAAAFLAVRFRARRAGIFPAVEPRRRFGGLYAGGSNARIFFGRAGNRE